MKRMKWWLLCWLVQSLVSHKITCKYLDKNHGSDDGQNQGPDQGPNQGSDKGPNQGPDKGPNQGSDKGPNQRPDKCPNQGSDKGPNQGPDKGPNQGSDKGPNQRSDKCPNPDQKCKKSKTKKTGVSDARCCMDDVNSILKNGNHHDAIKAIEMLEDYLEETEVDETTSMSVSQLVTILYKPKGPFTGLDIYASENEAMSDKATSNSKVIVRLPREMDAGSNNTIVFCMATWPETNATTWGASDVLYERRLVGLSVRGKNISGLQERVNITMNLTTGINETQKPVCVFFNFSTEAYSSNGCLTLWERGQSHITCSCDHLTYFGVLMVSASLPPTDLKILTYITLIGCSLSLFALVITVLLFITNKKIRADVSMKVHINLAIALILLNLHLLPSQTVAAQSSTGLCLYMALSLHYSLLATFSWMALEGFHLYILLVRVFNIYIRRYLLKLSLVGWGIPAVIVSLVVIIDRDAYGRVPLDLSNSNGTAICYIGDNTIKMVTTVGVFSLVFSFNVIMLGVTVGRIVRLCKTKEFGQRDSKRAKRDVCTLLGVTTLLGITWGLVFFSFGYLTTPGLYLFCILNSLQGFFIFLWFVMSLRKSGNAATETSTETRSTNIQA
ncbi:adhesion G-protein coupled receptor G2-like [Siniperca chuatsi]|uniref:adhesion G-protein coupled receptor G2-like n=1 Tax=Siniperca chuatsi TaxID=119488 RepID=UPI001CE1F818|nr:adhesion G-protein coupled receptor G2-like [Siniperca chuatsi]